ncbi:uncharacterized protein TNCV_98671 [Trichonephila clavipes]|nr:uncharacterized protein TNCV_98671 [Trichonephila clavipes]
MYNSNESSKGPSNADAFSALETAMECLVALRPPSRSLFDAVQFQQDGATCHTARATIDFLKDTFGDRLISRFGPMNWPPRSCHLTPLDYFLWGYVKSLVYADKPQTLDHLEDNIRRVIANIRPHMLEKSSKIGRPDWTTSEPTVACQRIRRWKKVIPCNFKCPGEFVNSERALIGQGEYNKKKLVTFALESICLPFRASTFDIFCSSFG